MKIHEYQAKDVLKNYSIPVPVGFLATTVEESLEKAAKLNYQCVLKAQVHCGGRGKAGGIKLSKTKADVENYSKKLLGMKLVSIQTGPEGKLVSKILVEELTDISKELYIAITLDRAKCCPVIIASTAGGMDIEEIAKNSPELILKEYVNPVFGLLDFQALNLAKKLQLPQSMYKEAKNLFKNLYNLFIKEDCSLLEINPLVIKKDNSFVALDAKINFDDSALFRHKETVELRDLAEEDPLEVEASKFNLNYIKLDGNVGCMVNGAGLAMATMDIIKIAGASPANFLDVGGGASVEAIENALKILLKDKNVKVVFINIFGGILRCDNLAKGVVEAVKNVKVSLPLIIRLEGTNAEEGRNILNTSKLEFSVATTMEDAAKLVNNALK